MELTAEQIVFIKQDIRERGVTMDRLADSLVDHICCIMENEACVDFQKAYSSALANFGMDGLQKIQDETIFLLTLKNQIIMKKTMFVLGYLAVLLGIAGLLFKIQHWPGASVILTVGIVLLTLGFLPLFFIDRYRKAVN